MDSQHDKNLSGQDLWINPTGGMGDVLMLSGVLKQCLDKQPDIKYNLVRRSLYASIFRDHPAIRHIGYPPKDARVITTDYWARETLGKGTARAYQILARMFGMSTPVEEYLFLPGSVPEDQILHQLIPDSGRTRMAIAPVSASPRKMIPLQKWEELTRRFRERNFEVIQVGGTADSHVPGAISLLGLTTPQQLAGILKSCTLLLGVDNFLMHMAQLVRLKALIVWGPTDPDIYGYPDHQHVITTRAHCTMRNACLGPDTPENYSKPCPLKETHCMNLISVDDLFTSALKLAGN